MKAGPVIQIVAAAVAITGTLFLLNHFFNRGSYGPVASNDGGGAKNDKTAMPGSGGGGRQQNNSIQKVEILQRKDCLFPDEMLVEYDMSHQSDQWGTFNENWAN